jgi:transposase
MQDSGHTPEWNGPTVERVLSNGKRIFALSFRCWLVEQASQPGASVAGLALRHGINANQLRRWIKVERGPVRTQPSVSLLPVMISALPAPAPAATTPVIAQRVCERNHAAIPDASASAHTPIIEVDHGQIEVELGGVRLKIQGEVSLKALRMVMDALTK